MSRSCVTSVMNRYAHRTPHTRAQFRHCHQQLLAEGDAEGRCGRGGGWGGWRRPAAGGEVISTRLFTVAIENHRGNTQGGAQMTLPLELAAPKPAAHRVHGDLIESVGLRVIERKVPVPGDRAGVARLLTRQRVECTSLLARLQSRGAP